MFRHDVDLATQLDDAAAQKDLALVREHDLRHRLQTAEEHERNSDAQLEASRRLVQHLETECNDWKTRSLAAQAQVTKLEGDNNALTSAAADLRAEYENIKKRRDSAVTCQKNTDNRNEELKQEQDDARQLVEPLSELNKLQKR